MGADPTGSGSLEKLSVGAVDSDNDDRVWLTVRYIAYTAVPNASM